MKPGTLVGIFVLAYFSKASCRPFAGPGHVTYPSSNFKDLALCEYQEKISRTLPSLKSVALEYKISLQFKS